MYKGEEGIERELVVKYGQLVANLFLSFGSLMTRGVRCSSILLIDSAMPTRIPSYKSRARVRNSSI